MKFINHYIEKKNYINEFVPTPLGPPPSQLHIVSLCALLNKFLRKKVQRNFISSRKNGCLLQFFKIKAVKI